MLPPLAQPPQAAPRTRIDESRKSISVFNISIPCPYLDPGVHLLILIFGFVVRPVLLRKLHPGGEETMSPPNKGSVGPQGSSVSAGPRTSDSRGLDLVSLPAFRSSRRLFKEDHSAVTPQISSSSAAPHSLCPPH